MRISTYTDTSKSTQAISSFKTVQNMSSKHLTKPAKMSVLLVVLVVVFSECINSYSPMPINAVSRTAITGSSNKINLLQTNDMGFSSVFAAGNRQIQRVHMLKEDYTTTPAIDKYVRLPSAIVPVIMQSHDTEGYIINARGPAPKGPEPFGMVSNELQPLSDFVKDLVVSENPVLTMAASHFFEKRQGKRFRPTIVALMARALCPSLSDYQGSEQNRLQLQLGQITEMIHVASLIHDDVLDEADMRRGGAAVHSMYTNKVAVLAGDYLLARASVLLARLRNFDVVEVMATALDSLVQGEIMQARSSKEDLLDMNYYLRKSYFKTASLICASCKSVALLSGYNPEHPMTTAAEEFGHHMGMAYQIVDDILDFTGASATLGKPAQADMELGLATAPILYAMEEEPSLKQYIQRRFKQEGDIQKAVELASKTTCVERSFELADFHAQRAYEAAMRLPTNDARDALLRLLHIAIARDK